MDKLPHIQLGADGEILGEDPTARTSLHLRVQTRQDPILLGQLARPLNLVGHLVSDPARDILKIAVVNRYADAPPATGFIRNFGFQRGAIASSVAHDSHNILAVGVTDRDICNAVNLVVENRGGLAAVSEEFREVLPLPVAGLMSDGDGYTVAEQYSHLDRLAKGLGSKLGAPFMTLSFMALPVIPRLKLSDKGLFDAERFMFIDLTAE